MTLDHGDIHSKRASMGCRKWNIWICKLAVAARKSRGEKRKKKCLTFRQQGRSGIRATRRAGGKSGESRSRMQGVSSATSFGLVLGRDTEQGGAGKAKINPDEVKRDNWRAITQGEAGLGNKWVGTLMRTGTKKRSALFARRRGADSGKSHQRADERNTCNRSGQGRLDQNYERA